MREESFIRVGNVYAQIEGSLRPTVAALLAYRRPNYWFSSAYRQGRWDGWVKVVSPRTGAFPAGLVPHVVAKLKQQGIHVPIADLREKPEKDVALSVASNKMTLLPYQEEAVQQAMAAGRGVIHHPTGSGKTVVMIELCRRVGVKALVLVHTKVLLWQTFERFKEALDIPGLVGVIGDGVWEPANVTIATFQTLHRRLSTYYDAEALPFLATIGQVHVDEVHHLAAAKSFAAVMKALPGAYYRFGYSATPLKSEGDIEAWTNVTGWMGPIIHALPPEKGVAVGRLVPADIFLLPAGGVVDDSSWPEAYMTGIVQNDARNEQIAELARRLCKVGPTLILVERLAHGKELSRRLKVPFLFGDTKSLERSQEWQDMREGKRTLLVASRIADEGLDLPNLRFLILAGGGKAGHVVIQKVGRGMRAAEGKDRLTVFDFMDGGRYLGLHSLARRETYSKHSVYTLVETTLDELLPKEETL